jgi:hypothetical protein
MPAAPEPADAAPEPVDDAATPLPGPAVGALVERWALAAVWLSLPLTAGGAFAEALDGRERAVQVVASVLLWLGWTGAIVALLVPRTSSLTAARLLVPAAPVAAVAAALTGPFTVADLVAVTVGLVAFGLLLLPATADRMVTGSSYGDEVRFLLKTPGPLLLGPLQLMWALTMAGAVTGPLLLAAGQWVAGAAATVIGAGLVVVGVRAVHGLSRRWVVFVPAGLVLHDLMAMADALLVPRKLLGRIGPAPSGSDATDLTMGSAGLALQLDLTEPTVIAPRPRNPRHPTLEPIHVTALLVSPARPGALLHEARHRRLRVG